MTFEDPRDVESLVTAAAKLKRSKDFSLRRIGSELHEDAKSYQRLQAMDIKSPAELRAALREYISVRSKKENEDPIKAMERKLIGRDIAGFFPTPRPLIERMLDEADIQDGHKVLEPSAGKGDILDAVKARHPEADAEGLEINSDLRGIIEAKGHKLAGHDFMEHKGEYDRVVMNPPYESGQDAEHVRHAFGMLKPGGRLVAVISEGPFFRQDKKSQEFRDWLDALGGTSEKLPEGSFAGKDSFRQTGVNTRLVVVTKPSGPQQYSRGQSMSVFSILFGQPLRLSRRAARAFPVLFGRSGQPVRYFQLSGGYAGGGRLWSDEDERKHPRDEHGHWAKKGEGEPAKTEDEKPKKPAAQMADEPFTLEEAKPKAKKSKRDHNILLWGEETGKDKQDGGQQAEPERGGGERLPDGPGHDDGGLPGGGDRGRDSTGAQTLVTARAGFTKPADPSLVPESVREHLRQHQQEGVALAIDGMEKEGGFLLADGTGAGKSREVLGVAKHFADKGKAVLIVSKNEAIGKPNWKKPVITGSFADDSKAMGIPLTPTSGGDELQPGQVYISGYSKIQDIAGKVSKDTVLILDEAHAAKNPTSTRAMATIEAARKAHAVMYATATPADNPHNLNYLLRAGIFDKGEKETYTKLGMMPHEVVVKDPNGGRKTVTEWTINPAVGEAEVLRRMSVMFDDLTDKGLMVKREISMKGVKVNFHRIQLPQEAHDVMEKIESELGGLEGASGLMKARILMHQRRQQETYKIPHVVEQAKKDLDAGKQVVIFASRVNESTVNKTVKEWNGESYEKVKVPIHSSEGTAKLLREALEKEGVKDIVELHGGSELKAPAAMEQFQSGKAKVVIATIESGGTGINLDDRTGNAPRSMIVMTAPFSGNDNVQAAGRIHRLTTKSPSEIHYMFGDTAVDDWNAGIIGSKMETLHAAVEGELKRLKVPDLSEEGTIESVGSEDLATDVPVHSSKEKLSALAGGTDRERSQAESIRDSFIASMERREREIHHKAMDKGESQKDRDLAAKRLKNVRDQFDMVARVADPKWWIDHRYENLKSMHEKAKDHLGIKEEKVDFGTFSWERPSLRGSDKQKQWADSIRTTALRSYRDRIAAHEQQFHEAASADEKKAIAQVAKADHENMTKALKQDRAAWWIETRYHNPHELHKHVAEEPKREKEEASQPETPKPVEAPKPTEESKPAEAPKPVEEPKPAAKKSSGTFAKLRDGSWGMRVEGEVKPGDYVKLKRKDGSSQEKKVREVVWTGQGVTLASFYGRYPDSPLTFVRLDGSLNYSRTLWGPSDLERILFGRYCEEPIRYGTFMLSSGSGAHQGRLWDESKHHRDHGRFVSKGGDKFKASEGKYFHVTKKGVGDTIRKEGFKPGSRSGLEMGPGVYLAADQERFPTWMKSHASGETFETETLPVQISENVKFFHLDSEAPNPATYIYRNLFGDSWSKKYEADSDSGKIFSGSLLNWGHLHGLLKEGGYGGIRRSAREGDVGNTDVVVFDPNHLRVQPATAEHHATLWGEKFAAEVARLKTRMPDMDDANIQLGAKMNLAVSHKDDEGTTHLHDGSRVRVVRTPGGKAHRAEVTLPDGKVVHGPAWQMPERAERNGILIAVRGSAKYSRGKRPPRWTFCSRAANILFGLSA